tara:strand:- start:679 stop:951 length:273 start_codon:yes stop_codon:yes gene_type:complete
MKNYFRNKLKERLTYCQAWKHSADIYLTSKEITKKTDVKYYESRPLLKLILDIYFIPYNIFKFLRYLRMLHDYKKNQIEIEVLVRELKEK